MPIVHTSLIYEAYQTFSSSLPYGKEMPWPERKVFETWTGVNIVVLYVSISNAKVTYKCTLILIKEFEREFRLNNNSKLKLMAVL